MSISSYFLALLMLCIGSTIICDVKPALDPEVEFELYERQDSNGTVYLTAMLSNAIKIPAEYIGKVNFGYNAKTKIGFIDWLHISPTERKKSFGSMLLQFALDSLTECNCQEIRWTASPFDLSGKQTKQDMLPKLIAFYEKHGAKVASKEPTHASMLYHPKKGSSASQKQPAIAQ